MEAVDIRLTFGSLILSASFQTCGAFSCAGACRRPVGVVFIVSRLLAAEAITVAAFLVVKMAAPIDLKTEKAIISTVRVEQDVPMINSD